MPDIFGQSDHMFIRCSPYSQKVRQGCFLVHLKLYGFHPFPLGEAKQGQFYC